MITNARFLDYRSLETIVMHFHAGRFGFFSIEAIFDDPAFITAITTDIPIDLEPIPLWAGARLN
jgi:hypothetical protein